MKKEMSGSIMRIVIFSNVRLVPVSQAISGAISKWNLVIIFVVAGIPVLLVTAWSAFHPGMKFFTESLTMKSSNKSEF